MSALRLFAPLAFTAAMLITTSGCKPSDPPPPDYGEHEGYGEISAYFDGIFTDEDERRPEDNSPVHYHDITLEKGQIVNVRMVALTDLNTFLMIGTPNREGGYRNGTCIPGQYTESCIRFVAEQDGEYRIFANAAREEGRGKYEIFVYFETEEEAQEREAQLAADRAVAARSVREQRVEEIIGRVSPEVQELVRERMREVAEAREAKAQADAPTAEGATYGEAAHGAETDDPVDVPNAEPSSGH